MNWLGRVVIYFWATVALHFGALTVALNTQSWGLIVVLYCGMYAAMCGLGFLLVRRRPGMFSPVFAGFLWGSVAICAAGMLTENSNPLSVIWALLLILAFSQAMALAAVSTAVSRSIPQVKSLTVAATFSLILLTAESYVMLFDHLSWGFAFLLWAFLIAPVYVICAFVFSAWTIARLFGLVDALELPPSEKRDKKLSAALKRFGNVAYPPVALWWIITFFLWLMLIEEADEYRLAPYTLFYWPIG
ncbi:MAG: hypothetical protein WC712_06605 [Candidatus Brocadiia bacterium]